MEKTSVIFSRRSIRKYDSSRRVSREQIEDVLGAAMHAPSAMNKQPWEFVVVNEPKGIAEIMRIHPYCESLGEAGTAIIVCGDRDAQFKIPDGEYWLCDCSAATQNILLRAAELGLRTCWCGIYPEAVRCKAFRELLGLPKNIEPLALVIIGYPKESPEAGNRYVKSKVHWQKF